MTVSVLVGMIGSGKSTFARKRAEAGALVVCHDSLTKMLHAEYRYEEDLRDLYRQMEEALVRLALASGKDVVIDRTHLTRESRARWVGFARSVGVKVYAVKFPIEVPRAHALRRSRHDGRGRSLEQWVKVAEHHFAQAEAEPLSKSEGFDEVIFYREGGVVS
jgi:predicted kinase